MSFVRVGRSQYSQNQGKRPATVRPKKKTGVTKREWVSTVNDLSVHKLSPEEQSRRHEIHRSNNRALAQWELKEKALRRRLKHSHPSSPAPLNRASLSIIREVFSDQLQLCDVLARSDKAMAIVKDLFGDAPRRQTGTAPNLIAICFLGFPSVTVAPDCGSDSELPVVQRPDPPTHLSLLSQSMMDQQALNELEDSEDDYSDGGTYSISSNLKVDRHRNGHMVRAKVQNRGPKGRRGKSKVYHQGAGEHLPQTPCSSGTDPNPAGNRRNRSSRTSRGRSAECSGLSSSTLSSLGGNHSSLELLQTMLGQVETELDSLGHQEPHKTSDGLKQHNTQGLTGFSVALVSTLGRLARLLTQKEKEARSDARERKRLEEEVKEQRGLIDALTAETLALRDESAILQGRAAELEQRLDTVVLALGGLEGWGGHRTYETADPDCTGCESGALGYNRDIRQQPTPVSPAVLLSPPRQRDNCQLNQVVLSRAVEQEVSVPRPRDSVRSLSSASSFCSLPPPTAASSLAPAPNPPLPQEAMLAQITELSRQNSLIRAQLKHDRGKSLRVSVSPTNTSERAGSPSSGADRAASRNGTARRLSSASSVGKTAPQSSTDTGRTTPQNHAEREKEMTPSGEMPTQQTELTGIPGVVSVEQRLLELNRQSAAARSRLLELIEQQRQSTSARVSPSVSPIPPSACSPQSNGM
ncbi:spindle and centriole-associated protein 1 [Aplochiton taeniatus]